MKEQTFAQVMEQIGGNSQRSTAQQIKDLLRKLQGEIGAQPWIERTIVAVDALENNPYGIDKYGRPLEADGKAMLGFPMMKC